MEHVDFHLGRAITDDRVFPQFPMVWFTIISYFRFDNLHLPNDSLLDNPFLQTSFKESLSRKC